tara:strand:- start:526 stop:1251 length:726 start_codon:yes stop_codon:yes gene_type:complete
MHSNHLAYVLAICIYFLVYQKPFNKGVRVLCLIFLLGSLVLTKSSGGMVVILALLLYNIFSSRKISSGKKLMLVISFIATVALVISFSDKVAVQLYTFIDFDWEFIMTRVSDENFGGYNSVIWRLVYWIVTLFAFFSENFLTVIFGVGIDSLTKGNMPYSFMYTDPHNDFIKILVEFGLMGLFLFFILLKKIYNVTNKNFNVFILIIIPMLFGNAIVNFPFNIVIMSLIVYEFKQQRLLVK